MTDHEDDIEARLFSPRKPKLTATCVLTAAEDDPVIAKRIATAVREERERVLAEVERFARAQVYTSDLGPGDTCDVVDIDDLLKYLKKLRSEPCA